MDAEGINFSVGHMKRPDTGKDKRRIVRNPRYDNPTLDDILLFIKNLNVGSNDKAHLSKTARSIPNGSLSYFRSNYQKYLKP
jgi:hypothetical protein